MPIYEFKCSCGNEFEEICEIGTFTTVCKECKNFANKIMSISNFKVNGYNAKNGYHKTKHQQFIEDGPVMAERRQKRDGTKTAADALL